MKHNTTKRNLVRALGASLLIFALAIPVSAASSLITKTINAQFGVSITINDFPFIPKDAKGKDVQAMIVDGTTYLPVRALGEATGTTVHWDGAASTVRLYTSGNGEWIPVDRTFVNMMDAKPHSGNAALFYSYFDYSTDTTLLKSNSNQDYQTGFIYVGTDTVELNVAHIDIETDKQYNAIQFQISKILGSTGSIPLVVSIKDDDSDIVYKSVEITEGTQTIEADISGADKITIELHTADTWVHNESETRRVTIGDMRLRG